MFRFAITLFKIWGFRIRLDASWLVIAFLVIVSLGRSFFPSLIPNQPAEVYWVMAMIALMGIVASILLHELGHAVVARAHGLKIDAITLFIFGGVAELRDEPRNARSEFLIAVAGPAVSAVLAVIAWSAKEAALALGYSSAAAILWHLWLVNSVLLAFNLAPASPLDGGRVLRAGLWAWKKDLVKATRVASAMGSGFGFLLMGLGVLSLVAGSAMGGLWYIIIGWFIRGASRASYEQVLIKAKLSGKPVALFMSFAPPAVSTKARLGDVMREQFQERHWRVVPVTDESGYHGVLTRRRAAEAMDAHGSEICIGEIAERSAQEQRVTEQTDAAEALERMVRLRRDRLIVTGADGRVEGFLHMRDLINTPESSQHA